MKLRLAVCLASWVMLAAAPAGGQPEPPIPVQRGRAEFDAGREALKQGDLQGALAHFRASLALHRSPGTLLNLATCEDKLGMFASAVGHYDEVLGLLAKNDQRVKIAKERKAAIEPRIPTLRVQLEGEANPGLTVSVDGEALSASAVAAEIRADPGSHVVTISAPGYQERRHDVVLKAGEHQTLVVPPLTSRTDTPPPSPPPTTAAPPAKVVAAPPPVITAPPPKVEEPPPPDPNAPFRRVGFAALGAAGAAVVAGAITGGLALDRKAELDAACAGKGLRLCDPSLQPAHSEGLALAHGSTAAFVLSAAFLAMGVTFVVIDKRPRPLPSARLTAGPGSLLLHGRF